MFGMWQNMAKISIWRSRAPVCYNSGMKKAFSGVRAFTLIELLVVIAIIGLLTGIILTSLTSSKAKSRDAERVSDLGQIQLALELYFDRCHSYPLSATNNAGTDLADGVAHCSDQQGNPVVFSNYISKIPVPPSGTSQNYYGYVSSIPSGGTVPTDYVLYTVLESTNSASANSLVSGSSEPGYATSLISCDTNTHYCIGPK